MTTRYCAYGVDGDFKYKWQARLAGWLFNIKTAAKNKN